MLPEISSVPHMLTNFSALLNKYGLAVVTSSEVRNLPFSKLEDIISRDSNVINYHSDEDRGAWFAKDLGVWTIKKPTVTEQKKSLTVNCLQVMSWNC